MTQIEIATPNVQAARGRLAELQADRRAAVDALAGIETKIANGAGIKSPALFSARSDGADLIGWLDGRIGEAKNELAGAEQRLTELSDKARGARRELDALLARTATNMDSLSELMASAARVGDATAALTLAENRQRLVEMEAARLLAVIEELGEPAVP